MRSFPLGITPLYPIPLHEFGKLFRTRSLPFRRIHTKCPKESLARNGSCRSPVGHEIQKRPLAIQNQVSRLNGRFPVRSGHWSRRIGLWHSANCRHSMTPDSGHPNDCCTLEPAGMAIQTTRFERLLKASQLRAAADRIAAARSLAAENGSHRSARLLIGNRYPLAVREAACQVVDGCSAITAMPISAIVAPKASHRVIETPSTNFSHTSATAIYIPP